MNAAGSCACTKLYCRPRQTGDQHLLAAKTQAKIDHDNAKQPHSCICTQVNKKLSSGKYSEDVALAEFKCNVSFVAEHAWEMTMCKHKGVGYDIVYEHIAADLKPITYNYSLSKTFHRGTVTVNTQQQILKP